MAPVGASDCTFALGEEILRASDGRIVNDAGRLAGSALDMLSAVNNAAEFAGIDWYEAQRMASLYPARALGLDTELGIIAAGCRASLLALDKQRCITACWIDGISG
jgi:N-acetylglucosamine-6-phosphate deacetylase